MPEDGYEGVAHYYDLFDTKSNIELYLKFAQGKEKIIDIGAGTGRIAMPLIEEGYHVTLVEPSKDMLDIFRDKLTDYPFIIHDSASTFSVSQRFDLAIMSGVYDHLLDDEERVKTLNNIQKHLIDGGTLVFDVHLGLIRERELQLVDEVVVGEKTIQRYIGTEKHHDHFKTTLRYVTISENGMVVDEERVESLVGSATYDQVIQQLRDTGFLIKHYYGDYQCTSFQPGDPLLVVVAQKNRKA